MDHLYSPVMVLKFPWTSSLKSSSVIPHRFSHFLKQERNMKGYLERYPETTLIGVNDRSGRERKRRKKVDRKGNQKQQRKISPNQKPNQDCSIANRTNSRLNVPVYRKRAVIIIIKIKALSPKTRHRNLRIIVGVKTL